MKYIEKKTENEKKFFSKLKIIILNEIPIKVKTKKNFRTFFNLWKIRNIQNINNYSYISTIYLSKNQTKK